MAPRTQDDIEPGSKQGTVFLSHSVGGLFAELAVDDSQFFSDAVPGAMIMTMASPASDRFDKSTPRAIGVICRADNTDTGTFFTRGAAGTLLALDISVAGTLRAVSDNIAVGSMAIPGIAAGPKGFVFAWVSRVNPTSTGPADAVQSWLFAWNTTDATFDRTEFHHAAPTLGPSTATWGPFSNTITRFWHEMRTQTATEIAIDWTGYSPTVPTTSAVKVLPPLPLDVASGIGDESQLHGPVPQWALRHNKHARYRTWSPLVNKRYSTVHHITPSTPIDHPAYTVGPGEGTHYMSLGWLAGGPVPTDATHAWVRLHVQSWVSAGAAVPIGVRVYSLSKARIYSPEGGALVSYFVEEEFTRDEGLAGPGQWQLNALVKLAVGEDGWTWFCPAFAFDPQDVSANDANALIAIRALTAVPLISTVEGAA